MKKMACVITFLLLTLPCFGLLSPLNQSLDELGSILKSPEIQRFFPQGQPIVKIKRLEKGYLVMTDTQQVLVEVRYVPMTRPGKGQFKLIFQQPTPR